MQFVYTVVLTFFIATIVSKATPWDSMNVIYLKHQ